MTLAIPTMAIFDNGDGTVTASVASGDDAATNTLYTQVADGALGIPAWVSRGSRIGNGTVTLTVPAGVYWFRCRTALGLEGYDSPLAYAGVTGGQDAMHERIVQAIAARIRGLTLAETAESPGAIPGTHVYAQLIPDDKPIDLPAVLVTVEDEAETVAAATNARDDWAYPTRVAIFDRSSGDFTKGRPKYLKWREQIGLAFQSQRLAGVPEAYLCQLTPAKVVDSQIARYQILVSGFTLRFMVRQLRGLT